MKNTPSYQYATKVMNVSSFWGTGMEYNPGQTLGPQDVFRYGDCGQSWYDRLTVHLYVLTSVLQPTYLSTYLPTRPSYNLNLLPIRFFPHHILSFLPVVGARTLLMVTANSLLGQTSQGTATAITQVSTYRIVPTIYCSLLYCPI